MKDLKNLGNSAIAMCVLVAVALAVLLPNLFPSFLAPKPKFPVEISAEESIEPYSQYFPLKMQDIYENTGDYTYTLRQETSRLFDVVRTAQESKTGRLLCTIAYPKNNQGYELACQLLFDRYDHSDEKLYGEKVTEIFPEFKYTPVQIDRPEFQAEKVFNIVDGNGENTNSYVIFWDNVLVAIDLPQPTVTEQQAKIITQKLQNSQFIDFKKDK